MTSKANLFDPVLVSDLINKVKGKSSLAVLSAQAPIPFNGQKEFIFTMDKEIDIVAENGKKTEGGITVEPVTIIPIKFEYGARVSDEFMYASEEEKLDILQAFNEGFAAKIAKGLDIAAFHGVNPRTGEESAVVGNNCFDKAVSQTVTYVAEAPDANLEDAVAMVHEKDADVTGVAMSAAFASAMAKVKANGISQYPEFKFGANPGTVAGMKADVNRTVSAYGGDHAIVGDFANAFKWGYAKNIATQVIEYGDPDNSGKDLKGYNQVYLRAEMYLGWGILDGNAFARVAEA